MCVYLYAFSVARVYIVSNVQTCPEGASEDEFGTIAAAGRKHFQTQSQEALFSIFNFGITHESQIWKQTDEPLLVDPDKLIVPPIFPDNYIIRKDLAVNYSNLIKLDKEVGTILNELKSKYRIFKVSHYSSCISKDKLKDEFDKIANVL